MLSVDRRTIRRWCDDGTLPSFLTPGNHRRIAVAAIEAFRSGSLDSATKAKAVPSRDPTRLDSIRENVQALNWELQQRRVRRDLKKLEQEEQEEAAQQAAALREKENEQRERDAKRDAERERQEAEREMERAAARTAEERRKWESSWLRAALGCLGTDVSAALRIQVAEAVSQELDTLDHREHAELVKERVELVIDKVLLPYRRNFETATALADAVREARFVSIGCGWEQQPIMEQRVRAQTSAAIAALPEGATYADKEALARSTGRQLGQEFREQQYREAEAERARKSREAQADLYLCGVQSYLAKLEQAADGYDFEGERFQYSQRITKAIRPQLLAELPLDYVAGCKRVEELVDEFLARECSPH